MRVGAPAEVRLAGHTAVYSNGVIYIYGGQTPWHSRFLRTQKSLWKFHVRERFWAEVGQPNSPPRLSKLSLDIIYIIHKSPVPVS